MASTSKRFFALILMLGCLTACTGDKSSAILYGAPTPILQGESPTDTLCRIQEAFKSIPKPLIQSRAYQPPWTSYKIGAASVDYRGYHTIRLTPEALTFLRQHSRLELVASLIPLLRDPDLGGEAAALLAGIPAGTKSAQGGKTAKLAHALHESNYRTPENPGRWFENARANYAKANTLYGLINTTESIHQQRPANVEGTLESKIIGVLRAYSRVSLRAFQEQPFMPQPHGDDLIKAWVQNQPVPALTPSAQEFVDANDKQFTALALFPLLPEPGQSPIKHNELLMMYLLNLQQNYWVTSMGFSSGKDYIRALKTEFQHKVQNAMAASCGGENT